MEIGCIPSTLPNDRAPYRGISTFVNSMTESYEGMFDTAEMAAATAP